MFGNQALAQSSSGIEKSINLKAEYFKHAKITIVSEHDEVVYHGFDKLTDELKTMIPLPPPMTGKIENVKMNRPEPLPKDSSVIYDPESNKIKIDSGRNTANTPSAPSKNKVSAKAKVPSKLNVHKASRSESSIIDTAIEIAKNGGTFSLDGKMVTSEVAISKLKRLNVLEDVQIQEQPNGKRRMIITSEM